MAIKNNISRREFFAASAALSAGLMMAGESVGADVNTGKSISAKGKVDYSFSHYNPEFKKIKVAQIGVTHAHARGKMESFRKLTDYYEVVGIYEGDSQSKANAMKNKAYQGMRWFASADELLNYPGLEAVAVEVYKKDLVATGMRCAKAGKNIHFDKPAGESVEKFALLLKEMKRRKLTLQMGYMFRNNPGFQFCMDAVKKGWLGEIFEIHGVMSKTTSDRKRKALAAYKGGTMFELGCHLIDILVAIMAKPDKVTPYVRQTKPDKDGLNDNQLAVFEYNQATATIRSALAEVDGTKRRQFYVCGDKGTIEIKPLERPKLTLVLDRDRGQFTKGTQQVQLAELTGRYDDLLIEWAKVIRGEMKDRFGPEHDLLVEQCVLKASGVI